VSNLLSVSGRAMIEAMIAGDRDPHVLAGMARGVMRRKIPQLEEALRGHFDDHHGFICATMLRRIDALAADIATLDTKITEQVTPHLEVIERLDEIPGIGARSAEELIAEIGLDMTVFPTAAHLVSWAKFAPIDAQSAGRSKTSTTRQGQPHPHRFSSQPLGECSLVPPAQATLPQSRTADRQGYRWAGPAYGQPGWSARVVSSINDSHPCCVCPRQDSYLRSRLRRPDDWLVWAICSLLRPHLE
jgi:Transposase IS116/IS110/IS902 family